MLIGDLVKKSGLSKDTIRYYEKMGLIKLNKKERRENNYKEYSDDILVRLSLVKRLKLLGFTLNEISDTIEILLGETNPCTEILEAVNTKIDLVEQKMKELEEIKARLTAIQKNCNGNCSIDDILPSCINF
ncbi:MAG: MerR family transcriptional regulator [Sporocytophaga sp.]|uniref:MerR family transcriptional regulator n=1 Tax=Sporocytophaga sp. TaxID=2231183 RepID=UPI001B0B77C6|nr:MerR family transcriptional regulator [Sporocytophaga sp.]MBO9703001.1 MerR family transcriptional regulator [Sporocytophaga sp.]